MKRAPSFRWSVGLAVAAVLCVVASARAQGAAPALTACQLARLRSVPRWELDYSSRFTNDFTASGEDGTLTDRHISTRDWNYTERIERTFRLVVRVAGINGRTECSPCVAQHPATLTINAHVDSESFEGMICPAQISGCSDLDRCFRGECGGEPPCQQTRQRTIVTPAASATLDGTAERRVRGELALDYAVNPPTMTADLYAVRLTGALQNVTACGGPGDSNVNEVVFGAATDLAPNLTSGGDTAVRVVNGRFVVKGQASGSGTRLNVPPYVDPQPPASFPRTITASASWTLREAEPAQAALVGIEVNQAVQDWQQSVPLITNKATVVRAHVQPVGTGQVPVEGRLRGFRDGQELAGSPLPLDSVTTVGPAANVRRDPTRTLDWVLPPAWLDGDVELCVDSPTPLECQEPAEQGGTAGDCGVRVSFTPGPPLRVELVAVRWGPLISGSYAPVAAELDELEDRLAAIYPTARLDVSRGELRVLSLGKPDLTRVNSRLDTMRLADCAAGEACDRTYYGVLKPHDGLSFPVGSILAYGLANAVPGTVSSGTYTTIADHYARHVHAHEIAHVLGRPHAVDPALFGSDGNGNPQGPCDAVADTGAEVFPFFEGNRPTLGPMLSGEASLMFGVDTHWDKLISPRSTYELMGYCPGISATVGESKWISSHTYTQLRTFLESSWFGGTPTPAPSGAAGEVMLLRGTVDAAADTAELLPVLRLPAAHAPAPADAGTHVLELRTAGGTVLTSTPLTPLYAEADAPGAAHDATQGSFVVAVPAEADATEVRLLRNGSPKASLRASAHRPAVTITSPNGGETLGPGDATLAWDATDEDGDALTFFVQWSRDGGATWATLGTDWTERTLVVDSDLLPATTTARLRVVASDGFLTAVDESDADFTIPGKAPRVAILAPTGTKPIVGAQAAVLRGAARDVEDGRLADSALRWSSDLNGNLGTGGTVILEGTALVPGTHVLTLTATDRDGLTGTATVPLIVVRQGPICGDGTVDAGEACDDGNILGADECSADCLTSTGPTTTVVGSGSTTTTQPPSSCAAGCEDGDPCTENGCVAGVGCVSAARTGLAGASCRCERPPPAECGGIATPKALSRPVAKACGTLAKVGTATGKTAKKLGRRATAQLKKAASVSTKLGKRKLPRECADAWRARLVEASRQLATP